MQALLDATWEGKVQLPLSVYELSKKSHICVDGNNRCPHIPPADSPKSLLNHRVSGGLKASATDHISEEPHMHLKHDHVGTWFLAGKQVLFISNEQDL